MNAGKMVFAQIMEWVHPERFRRCVARYSGNYEVRHFSCWDQFLAMAFAQAHVPREFDGYRNLPSVS
jgi:hypothetical protein